MISKERFVSTDINFWVRRSQKTPAVDPLSRRTILAIFRFAYAKRNSAFRISAERPNSQIGGSPPFQEDHSAMSTNR